MSFIPSLGLRALSAVAAPTSEREPVSLADLLSWFTQGLPARNKTAEKSEVGRYLEEHGGELTDDLERAISRKFGRVVE